MPYSIEQRADREILMFCGTLDVTNLSSTSITTYWQFFVPKAMTITRLWAGYEAETGTGPANIVTLRRGTVALLSVNCTTAGTPVTDTAVDTGPLVTTAGETLNIAFTDANTDNDFVGLVVMVFGIPRTT